MHDVAVVGAGPIGLSVAAELKRRKLSVVQFDKGCVANTVNWFPAGMRFYSSGERLELNRFPLAARSEKPTREEYLAYLRAFVRFHELEINTYESVRSIAGEKGNFLLGTERRGGDRREYNVGRVVLAIGSTEFPRRLGVPGEDLPHVSHYFTEPHQYFGQRVVVVGARNSACDAAVILTHNGSRVTLVHRKPAVDTRYLKYWLHPEVTGMIRRREFETCFDANVISIDERGVDLKKNNGEVVRVDCDFVLLLTGYAPDFALLEQLGLDLAGDRQEPTIDEQTMESSRAGVYCAGTIVAGDQDPYRVFIENALHHAQRIGDAIESDLRRVPSLART